MIWLIGLGLLVLLGLGLLVLHEWSQEIDLDEEIR